MSVPVNEQETTISFMRNSDKAIIYTSDKTMLTKLHKLAKKEFGVEANRPGQTQRRYRQRDI